MSTNRISKYAGHANYEDIPKGPNGRALCRTCSTETAPPRRTFCSDACVHLWRLKTDSVYVRKCVFRRDKGICRCCSADVTKLLQLFAAYQNYVIDGQRTAAIRNGIVINGLEGWAIINAERRKIWVAWCAEHGIAEGQMDKSWWQADHIIPVAEGGGECDLSNYQTLCLKCHKAKTAEQARRKALARRTSPLFE